ncbi:PHP domain-containing protein [Glaciecola sp. KUL10]|uniref:PHP domain-containing protein n=1 Tax=Glaciecola sp. (strain KUL10) TaxID=2161813 RepID=UPI000D786A29|nr:PHP domain-containing protein [Glaciecola sp. KUL10]GBL05484.1 PHP-like protein [Glaciecola sp. KUL10]
MSLIIDLHSHTTHSDGALSPQELVMRAQQMQIDVLAITDHDTVSAISVAKEFAQKNDIKLEIVTGVELSTSWHGFDIHILGYNMDIDDPVLLKRLAAQLQERDERAKRICDKLAKCGIENVYEDALNHANGAQISRNHIANVLVDRQVCATHQLAFSKYLGKGKRAYATPKWITIQTAVEWITQAGGQAVIAHPSHYDMSTKWLRRLTTEFKAAGGVAMEVTHPNMQKQTKSLLLEVALSSELLGSAGSDFHAPGRWTELGRRLDISEQVKPIWHNWPVVLNHHKIHQRIA